MHRYRQGWLGGGSLSLFYPSDSLFHARQFKPLSSSKWAAALWRREDARRNQAAHRGNHRAQRGYVGELGGDDVTTAALLCGLDQADESVHR